MTDHSRRAHLAVEIRCQVELPGDLVPALIREISPVGARLFTSAPLAKERTALTLCVESSANCPGLRVAARVMFSRRRGEGSVTGIQFVDLDADAHRALHAYLAAALEGSGGGKRDTPRLHHRHEVTCESKSQVRAYLENISGGGLALALDAEVAVGDEITVTLRVGSLRPLVLPGHVVWVMATPAEGANTHHMGIKLGELDEETTGLLSRLRRAMLGVD